MLPQPPPHAKAPPASDGTVRSQRFWLGIRMTAVFLTVLFFASYWCAPLVIRSKPKSVETEGLHHLRQIGHALLKFEYEYGGFPDDTTIDAVQVSTETPLVLGSKTSNDYFRQLIATGIAESETMFFARVSGSKKENDYRMSGAHALGKGEVAFTLFHGATTKDNPDRPLVVIPMIPGTDRFDAVPFKGKAMILKRDSTVITVPIDKKGHVIINGRNMMDPDHPIWDGHAPVIAWPDF